MTARPTPNDSTVPKGVTPRRRIVDLLSASGGQLPESTLVEEVPRSTEACRRTLEELERAAEVERRSVGPRTVVTLPAYGAAGQQRYETSRA